MSRRARFLCLCTIALLPSVCFAKPVFVSNVAGDDRANGLFPDIRTAVDGPVATLGRALQVARGGDVIIVANTGIPYHESVQVDRPELASSDRPLAASEAFVYRHQSYKVDDQTLGEYPLVIDGQGAVLRGTRRLPAEVWQRVGADTYRYQPYRKGHYQVVVDGALASEVPPDRTQTAPPQLEPLQWCAVRGFVYFRVEPRRYVNQYEIEAPAFDIGLGLHNARNVVVRNLTIEQFRLDGIHVSGNCRNVRLENVRSTGNGRCGLTVTGTSQVQASALDLAGNRVAERQVLVKGRVVDGQ